MSEAYMRLQEKLNATGRAYLEGFSEEDFSGLGDVEREQVAMVLRSRAERGDGVALAGLRHAVSADEFRSFADRTLATRREIDMVTAQLAIDAFNEHANDETFARVIECLCSGDMVARRLTLHKLSLDRLTAAQQTRLVKLLVRFIEHERDSGLLMIQVGRFLELIGLTPGTDEFIRQASLLRSPDRRVRRGTLHDLHNNDVDMP